MKFRTAIAVSVGLLVASSLASINAQEKPQVDRTELPVKEPWYPPITTLDARDAKAPPVFEIKAPKGAAWDSIFKIPTSPGRTSASGWASASTGRSPIRPATPSSIRRRSARNSTASSLSAAASAAARISSSATAME